MHIKCMKRKRLSYSGFTITELSIVLAIVGLLFASVMGGGYLIDVAESRALLKQLDEITTSVNSFSIKYEALPGDGNVTRFGFTGSGNNDGYVLDAGSGITQLDGEIALFWNHLTQAGHLAANFDGDYSGASQVGVTFPEAKIGKEATNGLGVYGVAQDSNFLQLGAANETTPNVARYGNTLTPKQAHDIDQKIDDGYPNQGSVLGKGGTLANQNMDTDCVIGVDVGASDAGYDIEYEGVACQLQFRLIIG